MLKTMTVTMILACCALVIGGCLTSDTDDHDEFDRASLEQAAHEFELTAIPLCGDLNNVYFEAPMSCMKNGQLGLKDCHRTCDIDRAIAFTPGGETTCKIVGSTCTPWVCGPCQTVEFEQPLP
jgi:hypothetical protein